MRSCGTCQFYEQTHQAFVRYGRGDEVTEHGPWGQCLYPMPCPKGYPSVEPDQGVTCPVYKLRRPNELPK